MSTEQPEKELAETTQQINDVFGSDELTKAVETEEFKRFLEYIPIAIGVSKFIRGDQRICYANRAFETLTGQANKDCAGRDWSLLAAFKDESDSQVTLELESFDSAVQAKRNLRAAIEKVAGKLGNTPTICRKCYVHPEVLNSYMDGKLVLELKEKTESELRGDVQSFNPEEAAVLALCARANSSR